MGNWDGCNQSVSLMPEAASFYLAHGDLYFARGEYKKIVSGYSKAIERQPEREVFYRT